MANMAPDIPPQLAAMLGRGGAPAAPGGPGGDMPSAAQAVQDAIAAVDIARQVENEPEDVAVLAKILADLQKLLAKDQQEDDAAMGVGPAQKAMRRSMMGG